MKHVLVYEDDPEACRLIRDALMKGFIGAERVQSDFAAYLRIPSLPTLDDLIVHLARRGGAGGPALRPSGDPTIPIAYVGARGDDATTGRLSFPPGELVRLPRVAADLVCALTGVFPEPV